MFKRTYGTWPFLKVLANSELAFGYDALKDEYVDMFKAGIIDPTKVIRTALQVCYFKGAMS